MALSRTKLNKLMQEDKQRWYNDGINPEDYDEMGLGGRDEEENFLNAMQRERINSMKQLEALQNSSASSDTEHNPTYSKYLDAINGALQNQGNPIGTALYGLKTLANAVDANGEKALLTEEQKVNYANNNLSNLSQDTLDKLQEYSDLIENTDANRFSHIMSGSTNEEEARRIAEGENRMHQLKGELKNSLNIDDDTFNKYVSSQKYLTNLEKRRQQQEELAKEDSLAGENVASIASAPFRGIADAAGYLNQYLNPFRDETFDVDHNSAAFGLANYNNDVTNQTSKNIERDTGADREDASTAQKAKNFALQTLYQGGKSGLESLLRLGTMGQVGTIASAGIEAYDNARENAQERGLTKGQAIATATAQGIAEAAFEIIPVDNLGQMFKKGGETAAKGVKEVFKELGKQSAFEGLEEIETDLANQLTDAVINKDKSEFNTKVKDYQAQGMSEDDAFKETLKDTLIDTAQSFLGGAVGGLAGGGGAIASGVAVNREGKKLDGNYREVAQAIPDNIEDYKDEESYNKAMEVKAKAEELDTQDKVSSGERNQLRAGKRGSPVLVL